MLLYLALANVMSLILQTPHIHTSLFDLWHLHKAQHEIAICSKPTAHSSYATPTLWPKYSSNHRIPTSLKILLHSALRQVMTYVI